LRSLHSTDPGVFLPGMVSDHPLHSPDATLVTEFRMHPGMADTAESEQVFRVIVRGITVEMVDVKVPLSAADSSPLPVPLKNRTPDRFPAREGILLLCTDMDREPFAVHGACAPHGERALIAEPAKAVPVGAIVAGWIQRTVECTKMQLEVGAHDQKEGWFQDGIRMG